MSLSIKEQECIAAYRNASPEEKYALNCVFSEIKKGNIHTAAEVEALYDCKVKEYLNAN